MNSISVISLGCNFVKEQASFAYNEVTQNPLSSLLSVSKAALNVFKAWTVYNLYESSLSDLLCLKTYRHGTDPLAWLRIHFTGPDLTRGGKGGEARYYAQQGQISPYMQRDQGRFYAVEDYRAHADKLDAIDDYRGTKLTLKYYALRSTLSFCNLFIPLPTAIKGHYLYKAVKLIEENSFLSLTGWFCPSVKIHLDPDKNSGNYLDESDIKFFPDDYSDKGQDFPGACYTQSKISFSDVGFLGVLKNGLNTRVFSRINQNRGQFVWGVAQLVIAVFVTILLFPKVIPHTANFSATITSSFFKNRVTFYGLVVLVSYTGLQA